MDLRRVIEETVRREMGSSMSEGSGSAGRPKQHAPKAKECLPHFNGLEIEDPNQYLKIAEEALSLGDVAQTFWAGLVGKQMKGEALKWYAGVQFSNHTWESFKASFLLYFDGDTVQQRIRAKLFSEEQKETTSVEDFLRDKGRMFQRLNGTQDIKRSLPGFVQLILPALRSTMRNVDFQSLDHLIEKARQAQADFKDLKDRGPADKRSTPHNVTPTAVQASSTPATQTQQQTRPNRSCTYCNTTTHNTNVCRRDPTGPAYNPNYILTRNQGNGNGGRRAQGNPLEATRQ